MATWVVDEDDNPIRFRVKGMERADPDRIAICQIEVRPGGMAVFHEVDDRVYGVAPPPPLPAEVPTAMTRQERAEESVAKEREAAKLEREAKEEQDRTRAARRREPATPAT